MARAFSRIRVLIALLVVCSLVGAAAPAALAASSPQKSQPKLLAQAVTADVCLSLFQEGLVDVNGDATADLPTLLNALSSQDLGDLATATAIVNGACAGLVPAPTIPVSTTAAGGTPVTADVCLSLFQQGLVDVNGDATADLPTLLNALSSQDLGDLATATAIVNGACEGLVPAEPTAVPPTAVPPTEVPPTEVIVPTATAAANNGGGNTGGNTGGGDNGSATGGVSSGSGNGGNGGNTGGNTGNTGGNSGNSGSGATQSGANGTSQGNTSGSSVALPNTGTGPQPASNQSLVLMLTVLSLIALGAGIVSRRRTS